MTNTLYFNSLRKNDRNKAVHDASNRHNCRLDDNNPNHDPALSHNNIYYILSNRHTGELVKVEKPTEEDLKALYKLQEEEKIEATPTHRASTTVNNNNK